MNIWYHVQYYSMYNSLYTACKSKIYIHKNVFKIHVYLHINNFIKIPKTPYKTLSQLQTYCLTTYRLTSS